MLLGFFRIILVLVLALVRPSSQGSSESGESSPRQTVQPGVPYSAGDDNLTAQIPLLAAPGFLPALAEGPAAMPPPSLFRLNRTLFNPALYARMREVWFSGVPADATTAPPALMRRWYGAGAPAEERERFDATCASDFAAALEAVGPTAYPLPPVPDASAASSAWAAEQALVPQVASPFLPECATPEAGSEEEAAKNELSLILLLDQMPRNLFRKNQGVIYGHYDRISRSLLWSLLRRSPRADLHPSIRFAPVLRSWFYMPLMHSEHLEDHARYSELMSAFKEEVAAKGDEAAVKDIDNSISFGKRHAVLIEKFGRYPYRNEHLGRKTTAEEKEYLEGGGDSF